MTKVSVIVPVYNGQDFIEKCIMDVLNQTLEEFELLIVNDGCQDKTAEICQKYCKSDQRVKLINQKNEGVSVARNKGIDYATGEYICFMDCDDRIDKTYLQNLYDACKNNNVSISVCRIDGIDNNTGKCKSSKFMKDGYYDRIEALEELFKFKNLNWGPCGKMFHNSLLKEKIQFPKLDAYEDLAFVYKSIYLSTGIYFTNNCKYYYIFRDNVGAMDKFIKCPTTDVIIVADEILTFLKKENLSIWDTSFYGIISQVLMYSNNLKENDGTKIYFKEMRKFLSKYKYELILNRTIYYKEKIKILLFIIFNIY